MPRSWYRKTAVALASLLHSGAGPGVGFSTSVAAEASDERIATMSGESDRELWEGQLMGMRSRTVIALRDDRVVFCYGRRDGGYCRVASDIELADPLLGSRQSVTIDDKGSLDASESSTSSENRRAGSSAVADLGLLPGLPWGEARLFNVASTERVEVERLDDDRFVVCFERSHDSTVACSVGLIQNGELQPFESVLDHEAGSRLISVSIAAAGRRFAVCTRPAGRSLAEGDDGVVASAAVSSETERYVARAAGSITCRWAAIAGGVATKAKWTADAQFGPGVAGRSERVSS